MSAFSVDIGRQTMPPLVDGVVHSRLIRQTMTQLLRRLRFDRVAVKCTLLGFMNYGENVGFNFSR